MAEGIVLKPGTTYTITSDWASIAHNRLKAVTISPLATKAVKQVNPARLKVELSIDPNDEVFASRSIVLTAPNGHQVTATYLASSRKGAIGVFELRPGTTLSAGTVYTVKPVKMWAKATNVKLKAM